MPLPIAKILVIDLIKGESASVLDTAIRIENLSKKYIIGHQQEKYQTLRDILSNGTKSLFQNRAFNRKQIEEFWALKDISLAIKQGDRVGIIGRNGAGKSTLLKLLSRITEPTTGRIGIKGRVASLLEVGTGFHPELTGRENIYLNGAILGMDKAEIRQKFDEIVAFAEVEKFLDTPVKRYSSGMYVRLAFAVAAHLEPEILIVDEVLAVGDAQFQKKCLGKMQDVSQGQGRTVLFVSHNIDAIQRLCSQCILLDRGQLIAYGDTATCVAKYVANSFDRASPQDWIDLSQVRRKGTGEARFVRAAYSSLNETVSFQPYSEGALEFSLVIESDSDKSIGSLAVTIYSQSGTKLVNADSSAASKTISLHQGRNLVKLKIAKLHLNPDIYQVGFWLAYLTSHHSNQALDSIETAFEIEVISLTTEEKIGVQLNSDDGAVTCQIETLEVIVDRDLNYLV
jgi:lipopolysaccharide transport system ATP-binding protein